MNISIFIAQITAIVFLSFAVGMLFSSTFYSKEISKLLDNVVFIVLGGIMTIAAGWSIIQYHNLWVSDWRVLVTIIGWAALIKGVMFLAFPKSLQAFSPMYKAEYMKRWGILVLIVGLIFGYFGFIA